MENRRLRKELLEMVRDLHAVQPPADVVVHPKLVVTRKSGEAILRATRTGKPTRALREFMREGD
jgi:hypothetical protein